MRPQLTLPRLFAGASVLLAVLLAGLVAVFVNGSRRSILSTAEQLREAAGARAEALVRRELDVASDAASAIERDFAAGLIDAADRAGVERALKAAIAQSANLAEVTFTAARRDGFDAEGMAKLAGEKWQSSALREGESIRMERSSAGDPTDHPTFRAAASKRFDGEALWSDLAWWQRDERRVIVSVQQSVRDARGAFAGVVRAGLLTDAIDRLAKLKVVESDEADPHRVFLADPQGRLITRLSPGDRLESTGDALRVRASDVPPPIERALRMVQKGSGAFEIDGERWLATFRELEGSQDWLLGIVVPERAYTRDLQRERVRLLGICAAVLAAVVIGGALALLALRRGLGAITSMAGRMRGLDFSPASARVRFDDVQAVVDNLERAKTAMRALGKYVPIDLVRELYQSNREPTLGSEGRELSVLFTDLEGFTSLSERMSPDELARLLGAYLEVMTSAIRSTGGTVDKFVGDAVMALWNAPAERADHARLACEAIVRCREATRKLYASPSWAGLPPLRTRFGLHRDRVLVGHFGAPDRISYTAIGDGVNLAARLESLGKQYGVEVLVSDSIAKEVRDSFVLRLVDRVAVKGKSQAIEVFELLGRKGETLDALPIARRYEDAFAAYLRRDFARAIELLEAQQFDGPSRVLLGRCRELIGAPPPEGWDGVHVARAK